MRRENLLLIVDQSAWERCHASLQILAQLLDAHPRVRGLYLGQRPARAGDRKVGASGRARLSTEITVMCRRAAGKDMTRPSGGLRVGKTKLKGKINN